MRQRCDKLLRIADQVAIDQIRPELSGDLELFICFDSFADIYGSVRFLDGVVKLA